MNNVLSGHDPERLGRIIRREPERWHSEHNWEGGSGMVYCFEVWSLDEVFDNIECVYIYTKKDGTGSWKPLYVGQTCHLATRIDEHANGNEESDLRIQESGATHIHIHRLVGENNQRRVERDLLCNRMYTWHCNMQN